MTPQQIEQLSNREADILAIQQDRKAARKGFPFRLFSEISDRPPRKPWLLKGIYAMGETSALIGPPGSLKSAFMASVAAHVAMGEDWMGRLHKGLSYGVLYFALERADLVERRLKAYSRKLNASAPLTIAIVPAVFGLRTPANADKVIDTIREAERELETSIGLVIFDTFAKLVAADGGDENKAQDQGAVFANLQRIKNATGVHVALIGHTGKDETRGARGSNAILGDVDVMIEITGKDVRTATITKANDAPDGPLGSFESEIIDFGADEDGDPITVNIIRPCDASEGRSAGKAGPRLTGKQRLALECINEAILERGVTYNMTGGAAVRAVNPTHARDLHKRRYVGNGDGESGEAERKAWRRSFQELKDRALIAGETSRGQEWIWIT